MTPQIHISSTSINIGKGQQKVHMYFSFADQKLLSQIETENKAYIEAKIKSNGFTGGEGETLAVEFLNEKTLEQIMLIGLGKSSELTTQLLRNRLGEVVRTLHSAKISDIIIHTNETVEKVDDSIQSIVEGVVLGDYVFDEFKGNESKKKINHIKNAYIIFSNGDSKKIEEQTKTAIKKAEAVLLARHLINMPASHMHPSVLVAHAKEIEKLSGGSVNVNILDEEACNKLGMGAFLGVAKGSDRKPAFIVLRYKGKGKKKIALIGKSITFDSGGLSLKPSDSMMDMKADMSGGAAVLGVFHYLASEKPSTAFEEVFGILPACENMPSGKAMKPGDVVSSMNGKTIEVLNTDAEGRLTLADALVYAEKQLRADYSIDLATLTGACMVALGNDLAGLFTNDEQFEKEYAKLARNAGDEFWKLPLYKGYSKLMKSDVADLKNIGGGRYGGAITAGLFLQEFVEKMKWIHIDIAGPAYRENEKGTSPKGGSGWGVLSIINFLN